MTQPGMKFSNFDQAFSTNIMPNNYNAGGTRYDLNYIGMRDSDNPGILVIDSASRNRDKYANPHQYTIKLDPPYKEVTSVELITANIPNKGYVVDENHNKLFVQETTAQVVDEEYTTIEITPGNYDITDLCLAIETALNDATAYTGSPYTVSCDAVTDKVTISLKTGSYDEFNLLFAGRQIKTDPPSYKDDAGNYVGGWTTLFKTGSMGPIIGFDRTDHVDPEVNGNTYSYTGDFTYNLRIRKFISMFINRESSETSFNRVDSINDNVSGAFVVVPFDTEFNNFQMAKDYGTHNDTFIKRFPAPIGELNELDIEFRDSDGNLFDFNGHDHLLVFRVASQTRIGGYVEANNMTYHQKIHPEPPMQEQFSTKIHKSRKHKSRR